MGCTESLPEPNEFNRVHTTDPSLPTLGANHGVHPSPSEPTKVIVREKLFSWSGDSFNIKTSDGRPFGNGLHIQGKAFAFRDQMVLKDGEGRPVAVILRKFELLKRTFKIYITQPVYPGQAPSDRFYEGHRLFTYASVERKPYTIDQYVFVGRQTAGIPEYTIHRAGSFWPKNRVVKRRGLTAALMSGGTWDGNWNSYLITVNPGIDPCLMICLTAICDEMDEDK
jgi:hypothetical protein